MTPQLAQVPGPAALVPSLLFLAVAVALAFASRRREPDAHGFIDEYFLGSRSFGAVVLAMSTVATYGSVSSFVGGPGKASEVGFGWVYMASVQTVSLLLLFGVFGKRAALVSRRTDSPTLPDLLRKRYGSQAVAYLAAGAIVVFFAATMVAQFVGAARLFSAVTGMGYVWGLVLFGAVSVAFTALGGFRGVARTDVFCGVFMVVGIAILAAGILQGTGGLWPALDALRAAKPSLFDPLADGAMTPAFYASQWLLVGLCTLALPQSLVRCFGFRDARALHSALVVGTFVMGLVMVSVTFLGVLMHLWFPDAKAVGGIDGVVPATIAGRLGPWLASVAVLGPVAASVSTVSSLLISASGAIVHDCLERGSRRREQHDATVLPRRSVLATLGLGAVVLLLSVDPAEVIWKIVMFSFGGLECAFLVMVVAAFFWPRASAAGALASVVAGVGVYCLAMAFGVAPFGFHQIVLGLPASLAGMVAGSLLVPDTRFNPHLAAFFPRAR